MNVPSYSNYAILLKKNLYTLLRNQVFEKDIQQPQSSWKLEMTSKDDIYFGLPQGSILGPVLFKLYVADLEILSSTSVQYADYTMIYDSCKNS